MVIVEGNLLKVKTITCIIVCAFYIKITRDFMNITSI